MRLVVATLGVVVSTCMRLVLATLDAPTRGLGAALASLALAILGLGFRESLAEGLEVGLAVAFTADDPESVPAAAPDDAAQAAAHATAHAAAQASAQSAAVNAAVNAAVKAAVNAAEDWKEGSGGDGWRCRRGGGCGGRGARCGGRGRWFHNALEFIVHPQGFVKRFVVAKPKVAKGRERLSHRLRAVQRPRRAVLSAAPPSAAALGAASVKELV